MTHPFYILQKMPSIVVDAKLPPPRGQAAPAAAAAASIKVAPTHSANIGSFRAAEDWEDALPSNLRNLLGKILIKHFDGQNKGSTN